VILPQGGLDVVLNAMITWPSDPAVQSKGCLALGNIGFSSEGETMVLARGGVTALATALRTNITNAAVVEEASDAIANLVASPVGRKVLSDFWAAQGVGMQGLVDTLEYAGGLHPGCSSVRECLDAVRGNPMSD